MKPIERAVVAVFPSAHWSQAEVIETECDHRHVRPKGMYRVGDALYCPFCRDEANSKNGTDVPILTQS